MGASRTNSRSRRAERASAGTRLGGCTARVEVRAEEREDSSNAYEEGDRRRVHDLRLVWVFRDAPDFAPASMANPCLALLLVAGAAEAIAARARSSLRRRAELAFSEHFLVVRDAARLDEAVIFVGLRPSDFGFGLGARLCWREPRNGTDEAKQPACAVAPKEGAIDPHEARACRPVPAPSTRAPLRF